MTNQTDHIATATAPNAFADWPVEVHADMLANQNSGCVGSVLVSETDDLRIWHLHLPAGQRCAFHRHVNPYFWTAMTVGTARTYFSSGKIADMTYHVGQTQHYDYGDGEYMLHSLQNIGETELVFVTVEHMNGANDPLPIPDSVRLHS